MIVDEIDVGLIFQSPHARPLDKANVARLVSSIHQVGLLQAICVRRVTRHRGTTPFDAYEIVAGHHRYAAALDMKWKAIRCEVVTMDNLKAELAEIDENLIRANLTPAQEASAIARRKSIYEAMHPETKHGGDRRSDQVGDLHTRSERFTSATADATGRDESAIRRAAARGRALGDELDGIAGTSLDKGAELDALAKMNPEARAPLIALAKAGETVSARPAKPPTIAADPLTDELAAEKQVARLMDAWNAASSDARAEFLLRIESAA